MNAQRAYIKGFSLIELCICCAVAAVLLCCAVPAMKSMQQKQRLLSLAQTLMTDLQQARSETVRSGTAVHLSFSNHAKGSCYVVYAGAGKQCSCNEAGQAVCAKPEALIKLQWLPSEQAVRLRSNVNTVSFDPAQGVAFKAGSIELSTDNAMSVKQIVSIAGRVRTCSPNGSVTSVPACAV